jgi:hypothetical protein
MKRINILIGMILISFLILIIYLAVTLLMPQEDHEKKVCFNQTCFNVEIADSFSEKSRGLMFRDSLDKNKGMLFVYETPGIYSFWMQNTQIPLDIIWISQEKEVIHIETAYPCEICTGISPEKQALYVLELNAGTAEKIGLKTGHKIIFSD